MRFLRLTPPQAALTGIVLAALTIATAHAQSAPSTAKPAPDVVVFTNGDQLTGTLEHSLGDSIVFKSDMAGEITVPFAKVKELHSSGHFAVLRKNIPATPANVATGNLVFSGGNVTVTSSSAVPVTVPTAQVAYILEQSTYQNDLARKAGPLTGWSGTANGGATIVRSTDNGSTYTAGIALVRAIPTVPYLPARNRTTFNLQETYGKLTSPVIPQPAPPTPPTAPSVAVTSIFHADAERDQYFSPRLFALAQTSFDHNYAQGLKLQQVYGGGIGWSAIQNDRQGLDLKATAQYEKQAFQATSGAPSPSQNLIGSTLSEAYHRTLPRKLLFTQTASFLPAWNNTHAYSANGSAGLALPVYKRLSLAVSATDSFLNDPAAGYNQNSFQFITAASYTLK